MLGNIKGLRHVDYSSQFFRTGNIKKVTFNQNGFVYGPIRLSASPVLLVYKSVIEPVSDSDFIRNKIAIFLVRDPRDILVSSYYSFGYTHKLSRVLELKTMQQQQMIHIQSKTIDEYVIDSAESMLNNFETIDRLSKACDRCVLLKYEDMIENWDSFVKDLTRYINIKKRVLAHVYKESRPLDKEDETSHRRSGQVSGFRGKLKQETILSLNSTFKTVLERFRYEQ